MHNLEVTTVAQRPELIDRLYEIRDTWAPFMAGDKLAHALYDLVPLTFPEYCVVATVDDTVVARGRSIPFSADGDRRELYPDGGWDSVLQWGFADHRAGRTPTVASALEIVIDVDYLGRGLSRIMLAAMGDAARAAGLTTLVAPVRPTEKHLEPRTPMATYAFRTRDDGLPADPWVRVHVRAGGTLVQVAPASMVVAGSLEQWRTWTGLPFDRTGDVDVVGALVPVHCDVEHDHAAYVEPNIWIRHDVDR